MCGCGFDPNNPKHCPSNALLKAPSRNPYGAKFYGTAAISVGIDPAIQIFAGSACNKCYQVTGRGNIKGTRNFGQLTTLVLRAANFCPGNSNTACNNGKRHFDIAAPGFDFTKSSAADLKCADLYSGREAQAFGACEHWPKSSCNCNQFTDPILKEGCENFKSLNWNNPDVEYEEVKCPRELAVDCWYQNNDEVWPPFMNGYCARRDLPQQ